MQGYFRSSLRDLKKGFASPTEIAASMRIPSSVLIRKQEL
ncbi:Uncharacterized protein dnm_026000 [Desulfonema magnum]|uniref:Uncharacterized protein n=1 Tax=Desulfonema magnum TaxID=45655 RepID=A0A975GM62_9BACT|nr:Uncharacterized protein dnm_026000 [Desulfonema magnum]